MDNEDGDATDAEYVPDKDDIASAVDENLQQPSASNIESTQKPGKYSYIWEHFKRLSSSLAECNYCHKRLSWKTSVTNLKKHVEFKHPEISTPYKRQPSYFDRGRNTSTPIGSSDDENPEQSISAINDIESTQKPGKYSYIWEHCKRLSSGLAECNYCHTRLSWKTSLTNLKKHVERKHPEISTPYKRQPSHFDRDKNTLTPIGSSDDEDKEQPVSASNIESTQKPGKYSYIWEHFKRLSSSLTECNYCQKRLWKTSVTNLKKHVEFKHPEISTPYKRQPSDFDRDKNTRSPIGSSDDGNEEQSISASNIESTQKPGKYSYIWEHCKRLSSGLAECNYCHTKLSWKTSLTNLKKHVERKHPEISTPYKRQPSHFDRDKNTRTPIGSSDDENEEQPVSASNIESTQKPGKYSYIWEHFRRLSSSLAECNYCHKRLSWKTSVTNLKKHVKRKHPDSDVSTPYKRQPSYFERDKNTRTPIGSSDDENEEQPVSASNIESTQKPGKYSYIWEHFKRLSSSLAECNYCHKRLSWKTSVTNLKKHVKCKHPEISTPYKRQPSYFDRYKNTHTATGSSDDENSEQPVSASNDVESTQKPIKYFYIWEHCKRLSRSLAECNHCNKILSWKTTITNLKQHIRLIHPEILMMYKHKPRPSNFGRTGSSDDENPEKASRNSYIWIWDHCKRLSRSLAECNYCNKILSWKTTVTNLKQHIKLVHPEVPIPYTHKQKQRPSYERTRTATGDSDAETKNASLSRKVNKKNVWSFFKNHEDSFSEATCIICNTGVTFSSMSDLITHIIENHGQLDPITAARYIDGTYTPKMLNKSRRSKVWNYFDVIDHGSRQAKCQICQKSFSFMSSVSNLMKHIRKVHKKASASSDDEEKTVKRVEAVTRTKRSPGRNASINSYRSPCWKYFDVVNAEAKIARCKLCQRNFSYTNTPNLMKHLNRMHGSQESQPSEEEGDVREPEQSSAVWAYFKCLDQGLKIASCLICKKRTNYNEDMDLLRHLNRKHPRVDLGGVKSTPKKLMITENGDIFEIDEDAAKQEPVENQDDDDNADWSYNTDEVDALDTEYLEEKLSEAESDDYKPIKKKTKLAHVALNTLKTQQESSLDIFGRYMVSLLEKLPKHKSDQLQVDFIKQIMAAQMCTNKKDNNRVLLRHPINTRHPSQSIQNTRYSSSSMNNDDTRVTSNSEVQKLITSDGEIQHVTDNNDGLSVGEEITLMNDDD